jgi:ribosomal protein L35
LNIKIKLRKIAKKRFRNTSSFETQCWREIEDIEDIEA